MITVAHLPGLRTDLCRLCSRHQRKGRLTLCQDCPEAVRRVHLPIHVCPPAAVVQPGQLGLGLTGERGSR